MNVIFFLGVCQHQQDHPKIHAIVVISTQKSYKDKMYTTQRRMLKYNTMSLYVGGCILVGLQRKVSTIFQKSWPFCYK